MELEEREVGGPGRRIVLLFVLLTVVCVPYVVADEAKTDSPFYVGAVQRAIGISFTDEFSLTGEYRVELQRHASLPARIVVRVRGDAQVKRLRLLATVDDSFLAVSMRQGSDSFEYIAYLPTPRSELKVRVQAFLADGPVILSQASEVEVRCPGPRGGNAQLIQVNDTEREVKQLRYVLSALNRLIEVAP